MIRDDAAGISFHEIRRGDEIVGCFKLDPLYHERHDFARAFSIGLRGVLVDAGSQGTGIGRKAMGMLGGYVRARFPRAREVVLTVNHLNPARGRSISPRASATTARISLAARAGPSAS